MGFTLCAFPTLNVYEVDCSWCDRNEMTWYLLTMDFKSDTKIAENWNRRALFQAHVCVCCEPSAASPPRLFFAISAQRKSMFPRSVCGKWCASRQMCFFFVFFFRRDTQAAGRATAGKSRRLNSICACRCRHCCTVRRRGDVISLRTGEGHGGSSGCFGPGIKLFTVLPVCFRLHIGFEIHAIKVQVQVPSHIFTLTW